MPPSPWGLVLTIGVELAAGMRLCRYTIRPAQAWALRWFCQLHSAANMDQPLARTGD